MSATLTRPADLLPRFNRDELAATGRWMHVRIGDRVVATLERARVYAPPSDPSWRLFLTDGREIGALYGAPVTRTWVAARLAAEGVR